MRLFLIVQETLSLCVHWKCANGIFIFCSLTSLCSVDPSCSTELKSKHFRDFEQFSCSYNRKNAEHSLDLPGPLWLVKVTQQGLLMLMSIGPP